MIIDSCKKNGRWIIPIKKFSRIRVKSFLYKWNYVTLQTFLGEPVREDKYI